MIPLLGCAHPPYCIKSPFTPDLKPSGLRLNPELLFAAGFEAGIPYWLVCPVTQSVVEAIGLAVEFG